MPLGNVHIMTFYKRPKKVILNAFNKIYYYSILKA